MNVKVFIFLAFIVAVLPSALSIRCYACSNNKDCDKVLNCTSIADTCMYIYTKAKNTYARSCIDKDSCQKSADACKQAGTCVVKCCQKDLCNKDGPKTPTKPSTANIQRPFSVVSAVSSFVASVFYLM
ncbi:ly-6/neurotoxin-like protein 1 [Actinia tenebrosa]|uniref:Ly-6/neurotoxin-like protein 1 n=1 Tax=Actinia tenebrosa TaxID=6105 RepID=A0A6P8HMW4_ACTTE|nr:ly-6/neurotoxin-like protein 1 [Actinia tenebrosa]